ncbi:hypothetical protein ACJ41O_001791 [Fusarium nematophilum]
MSQASFRCSLCPTNAPLAEDFVDHSLVLRRWASYRDLDRSAEAGCDLCTICRQYLANVSSVGNLVAYSGEVKLYTYRNDDQWALECGAFRGGLVLRLLDTVPDLDPVRELNDAEEAIVKAQQWLGQCLSGHQDCAGDVVSFYSNSTDPLSALPKRLIDLSHGDYLKVLNSADVFGHGSFDSMLPEYCTLSYRWGDTPHSCVLQRPFEGFLEINLNSVPQTFQDAVHVARSLGVQYLWIDALCIVQPSFGDDTEWLEEGSRMGVIYQNALVTIAATSALHANQGFLQRTGRSFFAAKPVSVQRHGDAASNQLHIPISVPRFYECVSDSPLSKRGWVMQERALSTRILHFTEHGLFWECGNLKAHDVHGTLQSRDDFPSCRSNESLLSVARTKRTSHMCPVEWFHFVKKYSYTEFTNPEDRLTALSSVAKAVQPYLGGHERRRRDLYTPSWSWAAVTAGVDLGVFSLRHYSYNLVEVLDVSSTPLVEANPYGRLRRGAITLKGRLAFEMLVRTDKKDFYSGLTVFWDDAIGDEETDGQVSLAERFTVLPIARDVRPLMAVTYIGALILEQAGEPELVQVEAGERLRTEYRRIGWVEYEYKHHAERDKRRWWEEREFEEIVLL